LTFAVWSARSRSKRCIQRSLTHTTVGSFENTNSIYNQLFISKWLKYSRSRIASMANHRDNQLPLHCFLNPTKKSMPRLAVASLALFIFFLCFASKSAFAADALASPLLAGGVSSPLRYFSSFLPAGWSPCPPQLNYINKTKRL
jgi:hypothetical protein